MRKDVVPMVTAYNAVREMQILRYFEVHDRLLSPEACARLKRVMTPAGNIVLNDPATPKSERFVTYMVRETAVT